MLEAQSAELAELVAAVRDLGNKVQTLSRRERDLSRQVACALARLELTDAIERLRPLHSLAPRGTGPPAVPARRLHPVKGGAGDVS